MQVDEKTLRVAPPFQLTAPERQSALWLKLQEHYQGVLASLRTQNDNALPPEETARLRGRISEVKSLLALGKPTPLVTTDR